MSSFRVERQRVSFLPQAEIVQSGLTPTRPGDDEFSQEKERLAWEKEQMEHTKAHMEQLREEAKNEAAELLNKARQDADRLLAKAQEEAKILTEQEKARGLTEGRKEAEIESRQRKAREEREFQQLEEELEKQYQSKVNEVQNSVAKLSMEIVEKIIGIKLEKTDTAFLNVIENAMSRFRQGERITVLLSNEDYQRYSGSERLSQIAQSRGKIVTLEKDASFHSGDCVLETESQFVDCGVSGQLTRLGKILRENDAEECVNGSNFAKIQGSLAEN